MGDLPQSILDRIGNTSLLALRHIRPTNGARILLKLESENPTGSMKDRMALAMVEAAEADGRLKPGGEPAVPAGAARHELTGIGAQGLSWLRRNGH